MVSELLRISCFVWTTDRRIGGQSHSDVTHHRRLDGIRGSAISVSWNQCSTKKSVELVGDTLHLEPCLVLSVGMSVRDLFSYYS